MDTKSQTAAPSPFDDGDWYDAMLHGLTYGIDFYVDLARNAGGPVLEVACGTGRILLPCVQAGVDIDGLDLSSAMLATLRKKAAALGLTPTIHQGDMSNFRLPRKYALIMITFNAFVHNLTQEAQVGTLESCRRHLLPGGTLVFDAFFPGSQYLGTPQNSRVLEGETTNPRTGQRLRCFDTRTFDRVEQIQHSVNEVETLDEQGNIVDVQRSECDMRWIFKGEMALLLRAAGFPRWEIYGGFDCKPLTQETDGMVVQAWVAK